jgi:predicted DNA-binding transcriptional regulator YafY
VITNRPVFERFLLIVALLKVGEFISVALIARKLEVHRKTIERDVDFLGDRLGLPIERSMKGIKLLEPLKLCPICLNKLPHE